MNGLRRSPGGDGAGGWGARLGAGEASAFQAGFPILRQPIWPGTAPA